MKNETEQHLVSSATTQGPTTAVQKSSTPLERPKPPFIPKIRQRIQELNDARGYPAVFLSRDFFLIAKQQTARTSLYRLCDSGEINWLAEGVFYKPMPDPEHPGTFLEPKPEEVAAALGRKFGWRIAPSGDLALYKLKLREEPPTCWYYICNGRTVHYELLGHKYIFKKTPLRFFGALSEVTSLAVQAVQTIGKGNLTEEHKARILEALQNADMSKNTIAEELRSVPTWIASTILKIARNLEE